jgi:two-component system, OmpR family, sensor kinase
MVVLLSGLSVGVYLAMGSALLDEIDTGLRFRAAALMSAPQRDEAETLRPSLEEPRESFDQLLTRSGTLLRSTPGLPHTPLVTLRQLERVDHPRFFQRKIAGVQDQARLLAVPLTAPGTEQVLVVGTTMSDRTDALRELSIALAVGGTLAVGLASLAGWWVAGLAVRPMEHMRRQASAITASGLDRRLELPRAHDELRRLAQTLNHMLGRLEEAVTGERRFLEQASHELRTPLAALKAELDLARNSERSLTELTSAVDSAAEETDRLVRLANDLLVLARSHGGMLPVRRETTSLDGMVDAASQMFRSRAENNGVRLECAVPRCNVQVDPVRIRQAIDNLLDNALRYTTAGGFVRVTASSEGDSVRLTVSDSGPGFSQAPADTSRREAAEDPERQGLGLRIVESIAAGHGGHVEFANSADGGAHVSIVLANARTDV